MKPREKWSDYPPGVSGLAGLGAELAEVQLAITRLQARVRLYSELPSPHFEMRMAEDFGSQMSAMHFVEATRSAVREMTARLYTHRWSAPLPEEIAVLIDRIKAKAKATPPTSRG